MSKFVIEVTAITLLTAMFLTGCNSEPLQSFIHKVKGVVAGNVCERPSVHEVMVTHSGFYTDDPVRGFQPPQGITLSIVNAKATEDLPDRTVCEAIFLMKGGKIPLAHAVMASNSKDDQAFLASEFMAGMGTSLEPGPNIFSQLFSSLAESLAMNIAALEAQGLKDDTPTEFRSVIIYSISKDRRSQDIPIAWSWQKGSSPWFWAAQTIKSVKDAQKTLRDLSPTPTASSKGWERSQDPGSSHQSN